MQNMQLPLKMFLTAFFVLALVVFLTTPIKNVSAQACISFCPADSCTACPPSNECYKSGNCGVSSGSDTGEGIPLENPIQATSVPQLVNSIVRAILGMVGALALFMFVYGGMLWMTSAGNTQRIEKGKETLIWATIGLIIIFASYAILQFIFKALSGKG